MCAEFGRKFVTLDDMADRKLAINSPKLFIAKYKPPVIIDEVQYAPDLFSYIKIAVDSTGQKPGMYWLTGSQKYQLMRGVRESMAGRVAILDLLGLSQAEIQKREKHIPFLPTDEWMEIARQQDNKNTIIEIYESIWRGLFPKALKEKTQHRDNFYSSYLNSYIQIDVKDIKEVGNDTDFYNFMIAVAARTGQILNYNDLARDVGINNNTAKAWFSILQTSGLVYLLYPWYRNITKRIIKRPKLYFMDTGLACYLTGWTDYGTLMRGANAGSMLETWVITEILKSYWHNGIEARFHYYRDMDQREVDLMIEVADGLYPVEIKKSSRVDRSLLKHFSFLKNLGKSIKRKSVICFTDNDLSISEDAVVIPISYL